MSVEKPKILFFCPSPRDIPEVKKAIKEILYKDHDVIWFKYFPEIDAYTLARKYFLSSSKYDYLCIIPDDLIINKDGMELLLNELENPSITDRYDVLSGVCNLSFLSDIQYHKIAASFEKQNFIVDSELENLDDIIKVYWIGFSCYFIHRSVVEKIRFRSFHYNGLDDNFSHDLAALNIDQYIMKKAKFIHLKGLSSRPIRYISTNPDRIYTGVYKPFIVLHSK